MKNLSDDFGKVKISKLIIKMAPPVMLAQLIQALYNIIDSIFIGNYSSSGLTALSIIYPIQLLMIAIAVGSGVGINTLISSLLGKGEKEKVIDVKGLSTILAIILYIIFAITFYFIMPTFASISTSNNEVILDVISYGRIVSVFSFGLFLESIWTKILQANGNMKQPMIAQIIGAIINIILDPIFIFVFKLGISGAAYATVIGQITSAIIVFKGGFSKPRNIKKSITYIKKIYELGFPNILMQSAYTFYIFGLNQILSTFSDDAVTALGIYYKWQTFFFIPLGALQTCIVPIISYNYATKDINRCKEALKLSVLYGLILMLIGTITFEAIPRQMITVFSNNENVKNIGEIGFRFIGISFIPMVTSLIFPVFFQALDMPIKSSILTIVRTLVLFVPLGFLFSLIGLNYFWLTFPITETITSIVGYVLYKNSINNHQKNTSKFD